MPPGGKKRKEDKKILVDFHRVCVTFAPKGKHYKIKLWSFSKVWRHDHSIYA